MNPDTASSPHSAESEPVAAALAAANLAMGAQAGAQSAPAADPGVTPAAAAEGDRIEQEWVVKTKQVLLATRNDPYEQARQLAALKADYMRKRYNKEIKLGK